jgi:hypothetical protein
MKKLMKVTGAQELSQKQQQQINGGGDPPCGGTPFTPQPHITDPAQCGWYGFDWHGGRCYACH